MLGRPVRLENGNRHIFEEDGRAALDTARLQWQCEVEKGAQLLRLGKDCTPLAMRHTAEVTVRKVETD